MRIHHATAKKAAKLGIEITEKGNQFVLVYEDNGLVTKDVKAGVAQIAAWIESDGEGDEPEWVAIEELDEEGDEDDGESKSIVKRKYKKLYRPSYNTNGDDLAQELKKHLFSEDDAGDMKLDVKKLVRFAKLNDCWISEYSKLNPGQARMNVGNRLRAKVRKGHEIVWG